MTLEVVLFSSNKTIGMAYRALRQEYGIQVRAYSNLGEIQRYAMGLNDNKTRLIGMQVDPTIANTQRGVFEETYALFANRETQGSETYGLFFPGAYDDRFHLIPSQRKVDFDGFNARLKEMARERNILSYKRTEEEPLVQVKTNIRAPLVLLSA